MKFLMIFTPKGKIGRLGYFLISFLYFFILLLGLSIFSIIENSPHIMVSNGNTIAVFHILFLEFIIWIKLCLANKRIRDINLHPGILFLLLIPILSLVFELYLIFKKSKSDNSQTKESPGAFALIAGLFIIIIIALSASNQIDNIIYYSRLITQSTQKNHQTPTIPSRDTSATSLHDHKEGPQQLNNVNKPPVIITDHSLLPGVSLTIPKVSMPNIGQQTINDDEILWCGIRGFLTASLNKAILTVPARKAKEALEKDTLERCVAPVSLEQFDPVKQVITTYREALIKGGTVWLVNQYSQSQHVIPEIDQDSLKIIQQSLVDFNDYHGKIDGKMGAKTRQALKHFQQRYGTIADGQLKTGDIALLAVYC